MSDRLAFLRGDHAEEALLIGWICLLVHALLVPILALVPAIGYLVAVARATIGGESTLPAVSLRSLLPEGTIASAICLVYGLPPLAVGAITVSLAAGTTADPATGAPFFLLGSTMTLCTVLAGLYVLPIALCGYARGGVRDALPGRAFRRTGTCAAYFVGWVGALVVFVASALAGGVVAAIPLVGPLLAPLVWWVGALATTRRLAAGYRAA